METLQNNERLTFKLQCVCTLYSSLPKNPSNLLSVCILWYCCSFASYYKCGLL